MHNSKRLSIVVLGLLLVGCQSTTTLSPMTAATKIRNTFGPPEPNRKQAQMHFSQAEAQFLAAAKLEGSARRAAFKAAAKPYEEASKIAGSSPLEEDALMMKAESLFFADHYLEADQAYDELVKKYARTRHMDKIDQRRFAIAQYWINLANSDSNVVPEFWNKEKPAIDSFGYAIKSFDKIRFDDPTGKLADDATMAAGIANFQKGKFGAADEFFTDVRENFPSSEHQFQAHFLGLKCKQGMYEGPSYDGGSLDDGINMIKQIHRLFPDKAKEHEQYLQAAYKDLRLKSANREFTMAKYYDNRKEYGAARIYYQTVIDEYADTSLAAKSKQRITAIAGLPDTPDQSLEWLASVFPDSPPAKPLISRDTPSTTKR